MTWTSYRRTKSLRSVDFPEPLGPTTAQLCPGSTFKLTPFSTGLPGWYLRRTRGLEGARETRSIVCQLREMVHQEGAACDSMQRGCCVVAHPKTTFLSSMDTPMFLPEVPASTAPFLHTAPPVSQLPQNSGCPSLQVNMYRPG